MREKKPSLLLLILFSLLKVSITGYCMLFKCIVADLDDPMSTTDIQHACQTKLYRYCKIWDYHMCIYKLKGMRPSCHHGQTTIWLSTVTNLSHSISLREIVCKTQTWRYQLPYSFWEIHELKIDCKIARCRL